MDQGKTSFIDYLSIIVKWRKYIIINFLIVSLIAAGISLILPKEFKASTTIVQPASEEGGLNFGSILSQLPLQGLGGMGMSEESMLIIAIVKSRTVMEKVVRQFDLIDRYKAKTMEEAVRGLRKDVDLNVNDDGTLTLYVKARTGYMASKSETDSSRLFAANMANYIIEISDQMNIKLRSERAGNTRIFLEKRYIQNLIDLADAEENLKSFQETHGAISLPEQATATLKTAAEFKAKIIMQQVKLKVLENYVGKTQANYLSAKTELDELEEKYKLFITGEDQSNNGDRSDTNYSDLFLPLDKTPELGMEYVRLLREVKIQETIMEFLLPQYEQAKIQETKDTAILQVVDKAVPPVKRNKPRRAFFVLFWGCLSLFICCSVFFTVEQIEMLKIQSPEQYRKYQALYDHIRSDICSIFTKK